MKKLTMLIALTGILISFNSIDFVYAEEARPQNQPPVETDDNTETSSACDSKNQGKALKLPGTFPVALESLVTINQSS